MPGGLRLALVGQAQHALGHAAAEGVGEPGTLEGEGLPLERIALEGDVEFALRRPGGALGPVEVPGVAVCRAALHDVVEVQARHQLGLRRIFQGHRVDHGTDGGLAGHARGRTLHALRRAAREVAAEVHVVDAVVDDVEVLQRGVPGAGHVLEAAQHVGDGVDVSQHAALEQQLERPMGRRPARLLVDHQADPGPLAGLHHAERIGVVEREGLLRQDRLAGGGDALHHRPALGSVNGQVDHVDVVARQQRIQVGGQKGDAVLRCGLAGVLLDHVAAGADGVAEVAVGAQMGAAHDVAAAHHADAIASLDVIGRRRWPVILGTQVNGWHESTSFKWPSRQVSVPHQRIPVSYPGFTCA